MTKKFNVYSRRLRPSWTPSGRGKTHLKSVSEQHRKDIWSGRGHEQFGVIKSADKTDLINPLTGDRPQQGQDYFSVRVYIPTVNGYFSQPKSGQKQLIEALLPEFIGPSFGGDPIPGQQARRRLCGEMHPRGAQRPRWGQSPRVPLDPWTHP